MAVVPRHQASDHDPQLYHPTSRATLLPSPASVGDDDVAFYREHGYLAVADVLSAPDIDEALQQIDALVAGRIAGYDGVQREAQGETLSGTDGVRKLWFSGEAQARQSGMPVDHPHILSVVSRLMNGQAARVFQTMALLKPPRIGTEKPWHQDHAYFDVPPEDRIVGVWVALDPATVENGCMQLLDGGHRAGPRPHWKRRDWQICDDDILGQASVAAELPPGGALFFDSLLPHGTPTNRSDQRRRAMQFHYAPADAASWTTEQRLAVFGSEGRDVSC